MKVLGADPASWQTGLAILEKKKLLHHEIWQADKEYDLAQNLCDLCDHVYWLCNDKSVGLVVIEKVSVTMNMDTVRKIAYSEAAVMIGAMRLGCPVKQINVTSARKTALGKSIPKLDAAERVREMYADKDLSLHETDAIILALSKGEKSDGRR